MSDKLARRLQSGNSVPQAICTGPWNSVLIVSRWGIEAQIRQQVSGVGQAPRQPADGDPVAAEPERENTGWGFLGNRDWENWGLSYSVSRDSWRWQFIVMN
jgi:hypothetical protein